MIGFYRITFGNDPVYVFMAIGSHDVQCEMNEVFVLLYHYHLFNELCLRLVYDLYVYVPYVTTHAYRFFWSNRGSMTFWSRKIKRWKDFKG